MATRAIGPWGLAALLVVPACSGRANDDTANADASTGSPATEGGDGADGSWDPGSTGDSGTTDGGDPTSNDGTTEESGDEAESGGGGSSTGDTPGAYPGLQGYGTDSTFGEGGESCVVTTLDADGPGSLQDCVANRDTQDGNPTPRVVTFDVGGTIQLTQHLRIRQPFLTLDGLSAPEPGITIEQTGDGSTGGVLINTWAPVGTCGHDVLVRGLRILGTWTPDQGSVGENWPSLILDGENVPGCLHHVVLDRVTVVGAIDSAGDIWGGATDVTVQYSAFLGNYHPSTWSHFPGGEPGQQRERISAHHNLWANNHERNPQIRALVLDLNYEQNIVHNWDAYGFRGGYGVRIRCRNGVCPQRLNFIGNHFTSTSSATGQTMVLGDVVGPDPDETMIAPEVYLADNRVPAGNTDNGSAPAEFPRPPVAEVDLVDPSEVVDAVLPHVGAPYRPATEEAIFDEVAATIEDEL
ncbi:MAG: hypothetical protein AAF721_14625 [Myxococcota bacterium]